VSRRTVLCLCLAALALAAETANKLSIYAFNLPDIKGKMVSFGQFRGKVLLLVNVASSSSYTPQYASLQALYDKYKSSGLVVLGFPSNDFGAQEPESEAKIEAFCQSTYHVTFPLFSKVEARGDEITPLFHYLTREANPKLKEDVHWNFTKFVMDRKGQLTARFKPDVLPDDPDLIVAIENALNGKKDSSPQTPSSPPEQTRTPRAQSGS